MTKGSRTSRSPAEAASKEEADRGDSDQSQGDGYVPARPEEDRQTVPPRKQGLPSLASREECHGHPGRDRQGQEGHDRPHAHFRLEQQLCPKKELEPQGNGDGHRHGEIGPVDPLIGAEWRQRQRSGLALV